MALSDGIKRKIEAQVHAALAGEHMTRAKLIAQTEALKEFAESRSQIAVFPEEREKASVTVERLEYRLAYIKVLGAIQGH